MLNNTPAHVAQLRQIETLIQSGQLPTAATRLNELARLHPQDPRVYLLGSLLAERSGNPEGMHKSAARARELSPHWYVSAWRLAQALWRVNQGAPALAMAQTALQQMPPESAEPRAPLLQQSADMAIAHGDYPQAEQWLTELLQAQPDAPIPRLQLAQLLAHTGRTDAALSHFDAVLASTPKSAPARIGRLQCLQRLQRQPEAEEEARQLEQLHADDPVALFHAQVVLDQRPAHQPAEMVQQLFDNYAVLYDRQMVHGLHYTLPQTVAQRILQWHPDRRLNLLDLGCGTGLLGACLGAVEGAIIGVDVSPNMIRQAMARKMYARFHQVNLMDALRDTPEGLYQVIAALDVFNYVGELKNLLPHACRVLAPGGRLVFSCEEQTAGRSTFQIDPRTLRYQHQRAGVLRHCERAGFVDVQVEDLDLRQEDKKPVPGFLVIARKSMG